MDTAIDGTMLAKMRNLGEACTAANRIYVHDSIAETFTARLAERMSALKLGDGTDPPLGVDVGPLVNAATRDKVAECFVADALAKGPAWNVAAPCQTAPASSTRPRSSSNVPETADCVHRRDILPAPSPRSRPSPTKRIDPARQRHPNTAGRLCLQPRFPARDAGLRAA